MGKVDVLTLTSRLKIENLEPLYVLQGEEYFLMDRFVEKLKKLVSAGPMAEFNYSRKRARETTGADILDEVLSVPMMAERRLVVVDEADALKKADLNVLDSLVDKPVRETTLVLTGLKFDLRLGFFRKANKKKLVHKSDLLKEWQLGRFIRSSASQRKVSITDTAVDALAAAVGSNCSALDDAVERLALYTGGERVGPEHVEEVVSSVRQHSIFELVDALGKRDASKAVELLHRLLADKEVPLKINAMLARHIRQLIIYKICSAQRMSERAMLSRLGVPPFVLAKLRGQSGQMTGRTLEAALIRLEKADIELKSHKRKPGLVLESALLDLSLGASGT